VTTTRDGAPNEVEAYLSELRDRQRRAWPAGVASELSYPFGEIPLTEYLRERARRQPEQVAYVFYGAEITFQQLDQASDRFGSFLRRHGVRPGDRVAVMLPNCPQFIVAFYGTLKAGAVHVPVNPMFKEAELEYELADAGAETILVADTLWPLIERVRGRTRLGLVLTTSVAEYVPERPSIPVHSAVMTRAERPPRGTFEWREVMATPPAAAWPEPDLDRLAALNYTGGTTGLPKGCMHTQRNMIYTAACATSIRLRRPDLEDDQDPVGLCFLPVFWIAGEDVAVIVPVFSGRTCVLMTRWDPDAVLEAVQRYRVTSFGTTVDGWVSLMEHPRVGQYDLSSLWAPTAMSFVRKLEVGHRERWKRLAGPHSVLREGAYGMTETHTIDTFTVGFQDGDRDLRSRPVFCGLPMPGTEIQIRDFDRSALVPCGREGEIWIRTTSLFKGYWRRPEASAEAFREGWFRTGDIGMLDGQGCLHFLGRRKEMLKVNGMSVFPAELEMLLGRHPDIEASGVIGWPDPERGEVPVAYVKLRPGADGKITANDLIAWCRRNMAGYKVPEVRIVEGLPLTATGKVRKEELRLHEASQPWRR
jgi:long-chain acyl-CoA synthetase